jgi:hypothetical protein
MMMADNTAYLHATRRRQEATRRRAEQAIDRLPPGRAASVAAVARAAGVARSWLYTQPDLMQRIRGHPGGPSAVTRGAASQESWRTRSEAAQRRVKDLTAENQRLRDQLARAYGALRTAGGNDPEPPATTERHADPPDRTWSVSTE